MLKDLRFSGTFHDEKISVNVMLEIPTDYAYDASTLLFSVTVRSKDDATVPNPYDFTFYVMDEANQLYNTLASSPSVHETTIGDEPTYRSDWLIHTELQSEFLYQNLRIAFYCPGYENIIIMELRH